MKTSRAVIILLTLVAVALTLGSVDAFAQKKKAAAPPSPAVEQQRPPAPPPGKGGMMLKDFLMHYKGAVTTLGRLKAVENDFIIIDDDGTETIYPIAAIHAIKVLKLDEETPDEAAPRLDIKLQ
jgi:hypothetical protein